MLNKKAMSPLLAMIILVSLIAAGSIMTLSWISYTIASKQTCENIHLELLTKDNKTSICYDFDTKEIKGILKNSGKVELNQVDIIINDNDKTNIINLKNLNINSQYTKRFKEKYEATKFPFSVRLIPKIKKRGEIEPIYCNNNKIDILEIQSCN